MKTFLALLVISTISAGLIWVALAGDRPTSAPPAPAATATATATSSPQAEPAPDPVGLAVRPPAAVAEYDRGAFGKAWSDDVTVAGGHNGCDTRNDILRRDLIDPQIRPGTFGCLVESGELEDPYTGQLVHFERGDREVEIDHVVALADAWRSGAAAWTPELRRDFANDPRNLLATAAQVNQDKGADTASEWLPPAADFRCDYVRTRVEVKRAYGLTVTQAEHDALASVLAGCPD
ncbi:HNH endonuclease family protein [Corynebacterium doosanense]|uniref:GmrSD restriction endonucleases C-terminal domain-containing protein n=1 Tax=Corynebacterium doosanense CAU 212 = DSM 45436 TaxID=558173 RepID=A0A097IFL9_9CORY|nr:HNH endonuclease family protein [Corynebacterium doosanense]AIT60910.1 hypothetical protein CDOO_06300 [Corynebacterium doosanense CAU 212 = DSM 45436]